MSFLPYILFLIGFPLLIKGADLLVDGASSIARRAHVSDLVIGLTVVAFGTSSPELFVNIISSLKGNTDIAIANVLGSNIANILLILGIASFIYPLSVSQGTVYKEIPLALLAAVMAGILVNDQWIDGAASSILTRIDGLVLLAFFSIFLYYSFSIAKTIKGMEEHIPSKQYSLLKSVGLVLLGLVGLILGGKWIVDGAVHMALRLGLSQSLVGVTVVAIGTSLPELATSAVAAARKNVEIAVGNVVGSNIFNVFFVLGISSVIKPIPFNLRNNLDMGVGVLAGLLLFICMFTGQRRSLDRWEGCILVGLYLCYMGVVAIQG